MPNNGSETKNSLFINGDDKTRLTDIERLRSLQREFARIGARLTYRADRSRRIIEIGISNSYEVIDLGLLTDFQSLKTVVLEGNSLPKLDLSPLKELQMLSHFELTETDSLKTLDLSPLTELRFLHRLFINRNSIEKLDTSPIAKMHSLGHLNLREVGGINNSSFTRRWYIYDYWNRNRYYQDCEGRGMDRYALDREDCRSTLQKLDLRFLEGHPSLRYVDLSYNRGVRKYILPKEPPVAVEYVDLSVNEFGSLAFKNVCSPYTHEIILKEAGLDEVQLEGIEEFKSIGKINLSHNRIKEIDLSPLIPLYNLHTLDLSRNRLKSVDLSPLKGKLNFAYLSLESNDLKTVDLTPIQGLPRLQVLRLGDNLLEEIDLSPLATVPELRVLRLTRNRLTKIDITPLQHCKKLQRVQLARNRLKELSLEPLRGIVTIEEINLDRNDFEKLDISAIESLPHIDFIDIRQTTQKTKIDFTPILTSDASWVQFDEEIDIEIDPEKLKDADIKNVSLLNDPVVEDAIDFKSNSDKLIEAKNPYLATRAIQENENLDELLILRFIENRPEVASMISRRINELKRQMDKNKKGKNNRKGRGKKKGNRKK